MQSNVYVSSISRSLNIYVRYCSDDSSLNEMMKKVQSWAEASENLDQIAKDLLCYVKYQANYYRARILETTSDRTLFQCIDFGTQDVILHKSNQEKVFKKMCKNGAEKPPFAFEVQLANAEIDRCVARKRGVKELLSSKYKNKQFEMDVVQEATQALPKLVNLVELKGEKKNLADVFKQLGITKTEKNVNLLFQLGEGQVEYVNYRPLPPKKVPLGQLHPLILESSDMASVTAQYLDYRLALPEKTVKKFLSSPQLETIVSACFQFERTLPNGHRAGYFIGDGPGVGKGRSIAGIIFENFLRTSKKSIWFSSSSNLQYDAERDLRDIGAGHINFHSFKNCTSRISTAQEGVMFLSYSTFIEESKSADPSSIQQLIQWCGGPDFNGVIIFDECQQTRSDISAGTSHPTKKCLAVLKLQKMLPKARILYVSSSGVLEPRTMECMIRLGLWGPGTSFKG